MSHLPPEIVSLIQSVAILIEIEQFAEDVARARRLWDRNEPIDRILAGSILTRLSNRVSNMQNEDHPNWEQFNALLPGSHAVVNKNNKGKQPLVG
jgi:hypothetical protein